jgi:hypothetical protein
VLEVVAFEQKGLAADLSESVGEAVAVVQAGAHLKTFSLRLIAKQFVNEAIYMNVKLA